MKTLLGIALITASASIHAFGFEDITTWAGTGTKQAAFVIDWNDGINPQSLVWGFRWNGGATGLDLLNAVMAVDPRLSRVNGGGGPNTIYGLGYDLDNDGFSITGTGDDAFATDADDHYKAGWFTAGFWGYYEVLGTTQLPTSWGWGSGSFIGATMIDQSWQGLSWAPAFSDSEPSAPENAPVPEPATMAALGLGVMALARKRRNHR